MRRGELDFRMWAPTGPGRAWEDEGGRSKGLCVARRRADGRNGDTSPSNGPPWNFIRTLLGVVSRLCGI